MWRSVYSVISRPLSHILITMATMKYNYHFWTAEDTVAHSGMTRKWHIRDSSLLIRGYTPRAPHPTVPTLCDKLNSPGMALKWGSYYEFLLMFWTWPSGAGSLGWSLVTTGPPIPGQPGPEPERGKNSPGNLISKLRS